MPGAFRRVAKLGLAAGLCVALDPRLGGRLTTWVLSLPAGGGGAGVAAGAGAAAGPAGPLWAAALLAILLAQAASVALASRCLFLARELPVLLSAPLSSRRLLADRVLRTVRELAGPAEPALLAVAWLALRAVAAGLLGDPSPEVLAGVLGATGLALAGGLLLAGSLGVLLSLALGAFERRWPTLGRVVSLPVAMVPLVLTAPLVRLGPRALRPSSGLLVAGVALLAFTGLVFGLGPAYRAVVCTPGRAARAAERRAWVPKWLRGPEGAIVARDVGLASSNGLTWVRLALCVALALAYPFVRGYLVSAGRVLLPGPFGLPLAFTMGIWLLTISELLLGLGQVDEAMSLTLMAAPGGGRRLRGGRTLSGVLLGTPPALAAGGVVLALAAGPSTGFGGHGPIGAGQVFAFFAAIISLCLGQAAIAASGSRLAASRENPEADAGSDALPTEGLGGPALLLEQVPLTSRGMRTLGLLGAHLALSLALPALVIARTGLDALPWGVLLLCALGLLPPVATACAFYAPRRWRRPNSQTPAAK